MYDGMHKDSAPYVHIKSWSATDDHMF